MHKKVGFYSFHLSVIGISLLVLYRTIKSAFQNQVQKPEIENLDKVDGPTVEVVSIPPKTTISVTEWLLSQGYKLGRAHYRYEDDDFSDISHFTLFTKKRRGGNLARVKTLFLLAWKYWDYEVLGDICTEGDCTKKGRSRYDWAFHSHGQCNLKSNQALVDEMANKFSVSILFIEETKEREFEKHRSFYM